MVQFATKWHVICHNLLSETRNWQQWSEFHIARPPFWVQIKPFEGPWTPNNKQYWPIWAYSSVERFHNDCAYSSLGHYIDDKILLLDISWNIAVSWKIRAFWGTIRAHKSPQWPLITFSYIHSLRWYNLQQNGMSYAIFYCQKPEIDRSDQNFTSRDHLFWSRLSLLKGLGPPMINST